MLTLDKANVGETYTICSLNGDGALRRRLMDLGLVNGSKITITKVAPLGDPIAFNVKGFVLSLRKTDASIVEVQ
ncbi:MAG: ferrous iron transport protein A [Clostridiales bacterium]|jgi:ferrous iron transport protein A|nr:ferrous iron transport protein A [Clostridiales bacterium]